MRYRQSLTLIRRKFSQRSHCLPKGRDRGG